MKAKDVDEGVNSEIHYSITGGVHQDYFTIDADSGLITTAKKLDYETRQSYLIDVTGIR